MKKVFILGLLFLFKISVLNAAPTTVTKIGIVNIQAAFERDIEAQKQVKGLEIEEREILKEEESARSSLEADMIKLQQGLSKMTDAAKAAEEEKLRKRIADLQEQFTKKRTALAQKKQIVLSEREKVYTSRIADIAKKKGFQMVIDEAAIRYIEPNIKKNNNITDDLVTESNKSTKSQSPAKSGKK